MNFKEGMRRVGVLLGVIGALVGAVASFGDASRVWRQYVTNRQFERALALPAVQMVPAYWLRSSEAFNRMRGAPPDPGDIAPLPEAGSREQALLLGLKPDSRVAIEGKFYDYDPSELSPKQRLRYEELVRSGKVVIHPPVVTIAGPQVKMETVLSFGNLWDRPAASKHEVPDDWVRIRGRSAKVPIDAGGIKSVTVDDGLVSAIELSTGESVQRTASPELYAYVQPLLYPLLGFFLPLGAIRAITWIGVGFFEPKAPAA